MQYVLTAEEMRWCDEKTIRSFGVPGLLLMENAGRGIVEFLRDNYKPLDSKQILIVCGKGNNGGDGFVVARLLLNYALFVTVLIVVSPSEFQGDAKKNYEILKKLASQSSSRIAISRFSKRTIRLIPKPDIIIDGIFGTGFTGSVKKPYSNVIHWMNQQEAPIVSIDIPSGVNGTTGVAFDEAICAKETLTFHALKTGLLCNQGRELTGKVNIIDIGIPKIIMASKKFNTFLVESIDTKHLLPNRSIHAHKYSVGKVLVIAGSKGMTGAAAMCAISALRAGAGAVMLGVPESIYPILARKLTEVMTFPLPATSEGSLSSQAERGICERFSWADVLAIGPGLSQNHETQQLIIKLLMLFKGKMLLDADGLNALAIHGINKIRLCPGQYILTPHVGEFSRLFKKTSTEIEQQRIEVTREAAKKTNSTIVLKGVPTVTAIKDGTIVLNSTGNPGMATAGSGDVLSGVIAALWSAGVTEEKAAWAGVYIHGLAGDIAKKKMGERSLLANDIIDNLPYAYQMIES
jgi:NAD(P)H-hydrate epimerase